MAPVAHPPNVVVQPQAQEQPTEPVETTLGKARVVLTWGMFPWECATLTKEIGDLCDRVMAAGQQEQRKQA